MKFVETLIAIIALLGCAALLTGSYAFGGICLGIVAVFVIISICISKAQLNEKAKNAELLREVASFNDYDSTLTLYKQSTLLDKFIRIEGCKDYDVRVSRGKTYAEGGKNRVYSAKDNGKCTLVFGDESKRINTVVLTPELFESAKQAGLSEHLDEEKQCINVFHKSERHNELWQQAITNYKINGYLGNQLYEEYPTLKEATLIYNWLTGRI